MFKALILIFALTISTSITLYAQASDHNEARTLVKSREILSLEIILKNLRKIAQGSVIEVELEHKKQKLVYEIELLDPQGVVTEYIFDAKTGELLQQKKED